MSKNVKNQTMIKKVAFVYPLTMGLYACLMLTLLAETWWLNPPPGSRLAITAIQLIPLTLPLQGLLKRNPRSAAWLCFILCFYFISGVLSVSAQPESPHGWLTAGVSCLLFTVSLLFIRWQSRLMKAS
ncbi:DUF2069 domain-containing protein [Endozoicomonas euniceicola]|uniref:DUF2069 domain-containing protein n=1 Tax=Endozoicomonas euniceicola TaxID=1234143 RepID=A0ABY6GVN9_9GAMM|nr:DUF2069 domain-containing protein [Endozoicomonas euniceicola]UYM16833.1 DUF2069 domain-containing protein [Endozoicomonas euniceicola]